jgi:hypothetical protein
VEQLNGLNVPKSLSDVCEPERLGLLVYDMQVGILEQIAGRENVIQNVQKVLDAARAAGVRTYFTRHVTLPVELMGAAQLRMWRSWQRADRLEDVRSPFLPTAPQTQIVPELRPSEREAVLDKLTLSAFAYPARAGVARRGRRGYRCRRRSDGDWHRTDGATRRGLGLHPGPRNRCVRRGQCRGRRPDDRSLAISGRGDADGRCRISGRARGTQLKVRGFADADVPDAKLAA